MSFTPLTIGTQKAGPSVNFTPLNEAADAAQAAQPKLVMGHVENPDKSGPSFGKLWENLKKIPGQLYDVGNKVTSGVGEDIAAAIGADGALKAQQNLNKADGDYMSMLIDKIKAAHAAGEDATHLQDLLRDYKPLGGNGNESMVKMFPALAKTNKEIAGDFVSLATTIIGAGSIGTTKVAGEGAKTVLGGAARGALEGAKQGAVLGAGSGAAEGLHNNEDAASIAEKAALHAAGGAAAGGVLGGILGGVQGGLQSRQLRKDELTRQLQDNPELVAKYKLNEAGEVVKDPQAAELVRQGLPEKHVAVIKSASDADKAKFQQMVSLADKATLDARAIERPTDVVGQTIVDRTKHLLDQTKVAGKAVDEAAATLAGKEVDPSPAVKTFIDNLNDMGVTFNKNGVPNFAGSDIEGIKPAEDLIKKTVNRMNSVQFDGLEVHKLKKFIDEQVTYGKVGEGLSGQTERVLKGLRRNLDGILDAKFENYNTANSAYSAARNLLDDTKSVLGKNFNPSSGAVRAGSVARRILGNSANRGDIIEYLGNLDKFFKETGGKGTDDIISQTVFADILEDIYGTQATTGLQGQVQRGVEKAAGVGKELVEGKPLAAVTKGLMHVYEETRGISDEAKIKALKALIGLK